MNQFIRFTLTLVTAVIFALPVTALAKKVELEKAEKLAKRFAESKHGSKAKANVRLKHTSKKKRQNQGAGLGSGRVSASSAQNESEDIVHYYVFNVDEDSGGGFVIVSGDDAAMPVLGYSKNGSYDEDNLPPNFAYWIEYLQKQIEYAQEQNLPQSEDVKQLWDNYLYGDNAERGEILADTVGPLLKTRWNQRAPYSNMTPLDGANRSVSGCVATAMAQIMKYHEHPVRGTGQSLAYTTRTAKISVPSVNFDEQADYDWVNMRDRYTTNTAADNPQNNAVAALMYHVGVSVRMDYGASSSGAYSNDVPVALTTFFGYDKSILRRSRSHFYDADWEAILKKQIDAGLPVYYSGRSSSGGHAFVMDGYDGNGKFHFNWGWGGTYDGYFITTALNPGTGGTGAGAGTYNESQEIIIDIKPDEGGVSSGHELTLSTFTAPDTVRQNQSFTVSVKLSSSQALRPGQLGAALVNDDDSILAVIRTSDVNMYSGSSYTFNLSNCKVPFTVGAGDYRLRIISKAPDGDWKIAVQSAVASNVPSLLKITVIPVPTIAVHPSDDTVYYGQKAQFTMEVDLNGADSLRYQWQLSTVFGGAFINLSDGDGYNSPTYTTPAVQMEMDNYIYRCIVTNNYDESISSGMVLLTVNRAVSKAEFLTYDLSSVTYDGNTKSVSAAPKSDITGFGEITVMYDGDTAAPKQAGTYAVTVNIAQGDNYAAADGILLGDFTVEKAYFDINGTAFDLKAFYGQSLSDVTLPSGWSWMNSRAAVGDIGSNVHSAKFTPDDTANYHVVENIDVTVNVVPHLSVLYHDRTLPFIPYEADAIISAGEFEFTAGPNPVGKSDREVKFFLSARSAAGGLLTVYDASGNIVRKINIRDNGGAVSGNRPLPVDFVNRRVVGVWDLKDAKGRAVPAGTYLIKGTLKAADGKREKVSLMLGVGIR